MREVKFQTFPWVDGLFKRSQNLQNADKTKEMLDSWCEATGIEFVSVEAEEAYKKRARRVADVIQLKVPDRLPVVPSFGMFPALDNGYTCEEVMFDYDKAHQSWIEWLIDVVGEGGGLMVDCGIWFDEAKHENVKAMVDFAKQYGVYTKEA
jgi:hypothetical protein